MSGRSRPVLRTRPGDIRGSEDDPPHITKVMCEAALIGPQEKMVCGAVPLRVLSWELEGNAPAVATTDVQATLVLLHGLGDGADIWRPVLDDWPTPNPILRVLALDLPGHGGSGRLTAGRYQIGTLAQIVAAALDHLSIDRPVLIGHSLGAQVALDLAGRELTRPRATVLIDYNPDADDHVDAAVGAHIDALTIGTTNIESLINLVQDRVPLADAQATRVAIGAMARATKSGWHVPLDPAVKEMLSRSDDGQANWALLRSIQGPVGIVRGEYSSVLLKKVAIRMAAMTRYPAPIETIARSGHAIPLEQPAALAASLQRHLKRFTQGL